MAIRADHLDFVALNHIQINMGFKQFVLLIMILAGCVPFGFSQGKLVFLNGREKRFSTAEVRGEFVVYKPEGNLSDRFRKADRYNVFSIVRDSSGEELIYNPDTLVDDDPKVEEAREYIKGEQYAMRVYKKPINTITGVAAGAAGSFAGYYGLVVPIVYSAVIGRFDPKIPSADKTVYSESFIAGYQRKSRNIKIKNSLIGGGIGFAVGLTTLILVLGND
jgi:hypothetical protein